jgi:quinol monooxygenase YgiN
MAEITVIAKAQAKAGHEDELERELRTTVVPTHAEEGNLHFSLHRSVENPAVIVAVERWASKEALAAHFATPHITALLEHTKDILAGPPDVQVLQYLPEGSSLKGRL